MNVARSTQLELLLITRTLDIITSTPGLSTAHFFEDFIKAINDLPDSSLSAYWKQVYDGRTSLVEVKASDSKDGNGAADTIVPHIDELNYLRSPKHAEIRHDPLLIIRKLYETASSALLSSNNDEKTTLLYSCLVMAAKSARASLLTHTIALLYIFKDESLGIRAQLLKNLANRSKELLQENQKRVETQQTQLKNIQNSYRHHHDQIFNLKQSLVLSFGKADHGKLGLGDAQLNRLIPTVVETLRGKSILKVASMSAYSLALNDTGDVYIWGTGGSVGAMPSNKADIMPQLLDALPLKVTIADISCGLGHALFLTTFGRVFAWGSGGNGRLGLGDTTDRTEACVIGSLSEEEIVGITCGASHSLALTEKGQLYSWGKNTQGQCGHGSVEDVLKPIIMKKLIDKAIVIVQVAAGWEHSLALSNDGKMYSWGCGYKDSRRGVIPPVLGLGHSECRTSPELISSIETIKIIAIASGWDHCMALDLEGKLLSWGSGQNGKLGHENEENISVPCYIPELEDVTMVRMAAGCEHSAAISADGILYSWGHGDGGRLGIGSNSQSFLPTKVNTLTDMGIIPHYLHCGDKFTIIIGHSRSTFRDSQSEGGSNSGWDIAQIQKWLLRSPPLASEESETSPAALTDVEGLLQFIEAADDELLCSSEDSILLILHAMLKAGAVYLLDPFQSADNTLSSAGNKEYSPMTIDIQDKEYCIEICEDTFSNLSYLLEMIAPVYHDYLQLFMKTTAEPTTTTALNRTKLNTSSRLDALLLQLYSLLSMNLYTLSYYMKVNKEASSSNNGGEIVLRAGSPEKLLDESNASNNNKERSDSTDARAAAKKDEPVNPLFELNKKLLSDLNLDFAYRKENSNPRSSSSASAMVNGAGGGGGGGAVGHSNAANTLSSTSPSKQQLNSSARFKDQQQQGESFYSNHSKTRKRDKRRHRGRPSEANPTDTSYDTSRHGQDNDNHDYDQLDDGDDEEGDYEYRSNSDSEVSQLYSGRNRNSIRRIDTEEEDESDLLHPTRDNVPSPAPSYESMENSFDERNRGGGNGDTYSIASSLQESDDYLEDMPVDTQQTLDDIDPENIELQRALLSSIDSSRRAALKFIQFPILKSIEQRRGGIYLPKIRNLLNTTSSLTFLSIQQYYEQPPSPGEESFQLTATEAEAFLAKIYATWESTQLVTAAGLDCLYDEQEQRAVLLQIIRSPESFLYIIPGLIKGFAKQELAFEVMVDSLFADSLATFYNEDATIDPSSSNSLTIDDLIRVVENLVNLYDRKPYLKPSSEVGGSRNNTDNIMNKLFDHIQESFGELVGQIVYIPIEWYLKLGNDEMNINDASNLEPWGNKMEVVLQLLLTAINSDLEKSMRQLVATILDPPLPSSIEPVDSNNLKTQSYKREENMNRSTFAKKLIQRIYSYGGGASTKKSSHSDDDDDGKHYSSRKNRQESWKICTISSLLPFSVQLVNNLDRIYQEGLLLTVAEEEKRFFSNKTALLGSSKESTDTLKEWYHSYLGLLNEYFSDLLCYLHILPRKWMEPSYYLYSSSSAILDYSALSPNQLRKYLLDWELIVWSSITERFSTFSNKVIVATSAAVPKSVLSEDEVYSMTIQLLQPFFNPSSPSAPSLVVYWQNAVQAKEEQSLEKKLVKFLLDLFESMTFTTSSSSRMHKHPSAGTIVSTSISIAPNEGLKMMDSFIDGGSDPGDTHDEESHDDALEEFSHQKRAIFLYLMRLFIDSENRTEGAKQDSKDSALPRSRLSNTYTAMILTFILQETIANSLEQEGINRRLSTLVHLSRLEDSTVNVNLSQLPSLFSGELLDLVRKGSFDIRLADELLEKTIRFATKSAVHLLQYDQQHPLHAPYSVHSTAHLLSNWKTKAFDSSALSRHSSVDELEPELYLVLLFLEHYSSSILKVGYLHQLQAMNKEISYQLYSWVLSKWQQLTITAQYFSPAVRHRTVKQPLFLTVFTQRCVSLAQESGYSSKRRANSVDALKGFDTQKLVTTIPHSVQLLLQIMQDYQQMSERAWASSTLIERVRSSLKKKDYASLITSIAAFRLLIEQQLQFMEGYSLFVQRTAVDDIFSARAQLLHWWQRLFWKLSALVKSHPFFFKKTAAARHEFKESGAENVVKGLFEENVACNRLIHKALALFAETVRFFPSLGQQEELPPQTTHQQEERRLFSTLLSLISYLMHNLSFYFTLLTSHFWLLKDCAVQYLLPRRYFLNQSSPLIASNLCAPNGNFTIGFWLFLPHAILEKYSKNEDDDSFQKKLKEPRSSNQNQDSDDEDAEAEQQKETKRKEESAADPEAKYQHRIHLFSRIPESGDVNMVDLITKNPHEIDSYTLSAHILVNSKSRQCFLEISAVSYVYDRDDKRNHNNSNAAATVPPTTARKKSLHRKSVKSLPLVPGEWSNVFIEVLQISPSTSTSNRNNATKPVSGFDQTYLVVSINNTVQACDRIVSGKWPLHENMVIGNLPSHLFRAKDAEEEEERGNGKGPQFEKIGGKDGKFVDPFGLRGGGFASSSDQKALPKHSHDPTELQIADVLWVPNSALHEEFGKYVATVRKSSGEQAAAELEFLSYLQARKDEYSSLASAERPPSHTFTYKSPHYISFLPSDVVFILQTLHQSISLFLDVAVEYYSALPLLHSPTTATWTGTGTLPLSMYQHMVKLFQFYPKLTIFGDKILQRKILNLLPVCIEKALPQEIFNEVFALIEDEKNSSIAFSDDDDDDDGDDDDGELNESFNENDTVNEQFEEEFNELESSLRESKDQNDFKRPSLSKAVTPVVGSTRNLMQIKQRFQQQIQHQQSHTHKSSVGTALIYQKKLMKQLLFCMKWSISFLSSLINPYFFLQISSAVMTNAATTAEFPQQSNSPIVSSLTINEDIEIFQLPWLSIMPISSQKQTNHQQSWRIWCKRVYLIRISIDFITNTPQWTQSIFATDENVFLRDLSSLFSSYFQQFPHDVPKLLKELVLLNNHSVTGNSHLIVGYEKMAIDLLLYACSGGWFPTLSTGSTVIYNPRRSYLTRNHRSHVDESMFVTEGKVCIDESSSVNGMTQILIAQSAGSYEVHDYLQKFTTENISLALMVSPSQSVANSDGSVVELDNNSPSYLPSHTLIVPSEEIQYIPTTELALVKDSSAVQDTKSFLSFFQHHPFSAQNQSTGSSATAAASPNVLLELLKGILLYSKRNDISHPSATNNKQQGTEGKLITAHHLSNSTQKSKTVPSKLNKAISTGTNTPAELSFEEELNSSSSSSSTQLHAMDQLMLLLASLRSHVVQLTQTPSIDSSNSSSAEETWKWSTVGNIPFSQVMKDLPSIIAIASLDPVEAAGTVFESSSFKGVQVDVLGNLLREGDITFLEKLSTKLWKQFKVEDQELFYQHSILSIESPLQLVALQGEVTIVGTKVRALSHFPSIRLLGVGLEKMSGRWFYECNLLSDGLMQIGWANSLFRCDPICGQGVGDHVHSWAYDGLRTKKWNVSCEAYGRRWRLGDIVGVLVDMDLMEMRFYLNGEDLGTAFEDFSGYEIFPAFSLNVRQSVRLNFGQFKFMYPPNLIDGKAFRPVIEAIIERKNGGSTAAGGSGAPNTSGVVRKGSKTGLSLAENIASAINLANAGHSDEQARMSMLVDDSNKNASTDSATPTNNNNNTASSGAIVTGAMTERGTGGGNEVRRILMQASNIRSSLISPSESSNATSADSPSRHQLAPSHANEQDDKSVMELPPYQEVEGGEDGSEHREHYDSEEGDEEENERDHRIDQEDPRYILNPRWEEDLEARIRMEVEEGDDYDVEEEEQQEDDEDEDNEGEEDGSNAGDQEEDREEEDGEEDEENTHLMELRRQAMIESLIGMGFPVDWALRAAEQVDVATSESAAISWIIERMELEQSKMNEMEGDSSSRGGEGEEYDETEAGIEYFMQRHSAAFGGANTGNTSSAGSANASSGANRAITDASTMITRRLVAEHMAELLENASNIENALNSGANIAGWSPGSPSREENFGGSTAAALINAVTSTTASGRSLLNPAALGLLMNTDAAYAALITAKMNSKKSKHASDNASSAAGGSDHSSLKEIEALELVFTESVPWNDEPFYLPMMPGLYPVAHRHDNEKQEVLTQVNDLDVLDMLPIIATCQFALCIYYSRMIVLRLLQSFHQEVLKERELSLSFLQSSEIIATTQYSTEISAKKEIQQFLSFFTVGSMYKFLKNSFRHAILTNYQSDRVFPYLSPATSQGDIYDKLPPLSPYLPYNRLKFTELMRQFELFYYPQCLSTIAVEEPSSDIISSLESLILLITGQAIEYTEKVLKDGDGEANTEDSSISKTEGKETEGRQGNNPEGREVNNSSISSSLSGLQDRILQRVGMNSPSSATPPIPPQHIGELCNTFLTVLIENCINNLERAATTMKFDAFDWIAGSLEKTPQHLYNEQHQKDNHHIIAEEDSTSTFPQVLFSYWCLKLIMSIALQYKIHENHVFLASNRGKSAPSGGNKDEEAPKKSKSGKEGKRSFPFYSLEENLFSKNNALFKLTTPEALTRILKISSTQNDSLRYCLYDIAAMNLSLVNMQLQMTLMKDIQYRFVQPSPLTQITAAEYYVSVAKEKRLLQSFGHRIKLESADKLLFTRYTRCIGSFLFQWYLLRRQLNLNTFSYMTEFKLSNLSPSHLTDLVAPGNPADEQGDEQEQQLAQRGRYLKVTQVSTSSVTVAWSLTKITGELSALMQNITGIDPSEQDDDVPSIYGYNLYITGLSYLGMETPMLVLSNIDYKGHFRVDDLEADTLYKISIKCDDKRRKREAKKAKRRKQLQSQYADHQLTREEEEEEEEDDDQDEDEEDDEEDSEEDEDAREHLRSPYHPFSVPSPKNLNVVVATDSEASFGFHSDSVSPNIILNSANPLTLRNVANKKWSTARANVRLTAGIHRWDVHIDRCISKNIFVGVATREARLDNYVGCDAYGWAFLANKAVWHGKAKMKNYGELFRTGDTISVILDLENGTLAYCLNDRPLGVAIDGLVGPLYPAFSLYNEDDQLTIAQVRSSSEHHSSFGSFASENILDRLESVRSLMQYFSFCHHQTMEEYQIQSLFNGTSVKTLTRDSEGKSVEIDLSPVKAGSAVSPNKADGGAVDNSEGLTPSTKKALQLQQEIRQIQKQYSNLSVEDEGVSPVPHSHQTSQAEEEENNRRKAAAMEEEESEEARLELMQQYTSKFTIFTEELIHEIYLRYQNWISNIAVRTIYYQQNIYVIQLSNDIVQRFTQKLCRLNDLVSIEKRVARVVGVGASKLWFRAEIDGELIAITHDTFLQMIEKRLIEVKAPAVEESPPHVVSPAAAALIFDGSCPEYHSIRSIIPSSSAALNHATHDKGVPRTLSIEEMKSLLFQNMNEWRHEEDDSLHYLLSLFARRLFASVSSPTSSTPSPRSGLTTISSNDYFTFSYLELFHFLLSFREDVIQPITSLTLSSSSGATVLNDLPQQLRSLVRLFTVHSLEAILLRILLFNLFNDLLVPLQPFLLPYSNSNGASVESDWLVPSFHCEYRTVISEISPNHPTAFLKSMRRYIYPFILEQMTVSLFYQYSIKMKEMTKAFCSFFSSLSYTSLVAASNSALISIAGNDTNEAVGISAKVISGSITTLSTLKKKLNPIEKLKYSNNFNTTDNSQNRTAANSPLTIQSSPTRDSYLAHTHNNLMNVPVAAYLQTIGGPGIVDNMSNNRISPTTLLSSTAPPALFQRGNTDTSINSLMSNGLEAVVPGGPGDTSTAIMSTINTRQPTRTNLLSHNLPASSHKISSLIDVPIMKDNQFILYVESTATFYAYLQQISHEKGILMDEASSLAQKRDWQLVYWLQSSYIGQLLQYFELLQMKFTQETLMHYHPASTYKPLQAIGSLTRLTPNHPNSTGGNKDAQNNNSLHPTNKKDTNNPNNPANGSGKENRKDFSLWEYCFRYHYMNDAPSTGDSIVGSSGGRRKKALPILIRCLPQFIGSSRTDLSFTSRESGFRKEKLLMSLQLLEAFPHIVSEETIFQIFLQEACDQIQELVDLLYHRSSSSSSRSLQEEDLSMEDLVHCEKQILHHCHVSEISIILQIFHATGVLLGIAFRNGFAPLIRFPTLIYSILANEEIVSTSAFFPSALSAAQPGEQSAASNTHNAQNNTKDSLAAQGKGLFMQEYEEYQRNMKTLSTSLKLLHSIGIVLRFGICSVYPEVLLDLWTKEKIAAVLSGCPHWNTLSSSFATISIEKMMQLTDYDANMSPQVEDSIHYFWLCLFELSPRQFQLFLQYLFAQTIEDFHALRSSAKETANNKTTTTVDLVLLQRWKHDLFFSSFPSSVPRELQRIRLSPRNITLQDLEVSMSASLATTYLSSEDYPIHIEQKDRAIILPPYSSIEVMSIKVQELLGTIERSEKR